jgi:hypothetical protein
MSLRRRITTLLTVGAVAYGGGWLALASSVAHAQCSQSSTEQTYGGQGTQITQTGCEPIQPSSTLPFTGLDLGLLVGAALILIAGGTVLRLRLRREDR